MINANMVEQWDGRSDFLISMRDHRWLWASDGVSGIDALGRQSQQESTLNSMNPESWGEVTILVMPFFSA